MIHPHHDLIVQWAKDTTQVVEYLELTSGEWFIEHLPNWYPEDLYRIRHKHQDLIDQKAARPELIIEAKYGDEWIVDEADWFNWMEYRLVEPVTKKVKMWQWVVQVQDSIWLSEFFYKSIEEAQAAMAGKVIQRADWTEICVEEE